MTIDTAKIYRNEALECRRHAHSTLNRALRERWLAKAADYDQLADRLESDSAAGQRRDPVVRFRS